MTYQPLRPVIQKLWVTAYHPLLCIGSPEYLLKIQILIQ